MSKETFETIFITPKKENFEIKNDKNDIGSSKITKIIPENISSSKVSVSSDDTCHSDNFFSNDNKLIDKNERLINELNIVKNKYDVLMNLYKESCENILKISENKQEMNKYIQTTNEKLFMLESLVEKGKIEFANTKEELAKIKEINQSTNFELNAMKLKFSENLMNVEEIRKENEKMKFQINLNTDEIMKLKFCLRSSNAEIEFLKAKLEKVSCKNFLINKKCDYNPFKIDFSENEYLHQSFKEILNSSDEELTKANVKHDTKSKGFSLKINEMSNINSKEHKEVKKFKNDKDNDKDKDNEIEKIKQIPKKEIENIIEKSVPKESNQLCKEDEKINNQNNSLFSNVINTNANSHIASIRKNEIIGVCYTTGNVCKNCSSGRGCRWAGQGRSGHY